MTHYSTGQSTKSAGVSELLQKIVDGWNTTIQQKLHQNKIA